jgi:hypothetical protein
VRVILKAWSKNPDNNGGCDFAVVEVTPRFATLALRRIAVLCQQRALDAALYETYYWGSEVEFFSPWADLGTQTDEVKAACLKLEEELDSLQVNRHEIVSVPDDFSVPQSQIARVECAQMVVREEGIAFTAIPKHNDFYVTTAEIPKVVLEQAAMAV